MAERKVDAFSHGGRGDRGHDMVGRRGDLKHRHRQGRRVDHLAADPPAAFAGQILPEHVDEKLPRGSACEGRAVIRPVLEPDEGLRCEKSGTDDLGLPVGRTVYWRDGVAIDTQYSNLAPQGYTAAIVSKIWG